MAAVVGWLPQSPVELMDSLLQFRLPAAVPLADLTFQNSGTGTRVPLGAFSYIKRVLSSDARE